MLKLSWKVSRLWPFEFLATACCFLGGAALVITHAALFHGDATWPPLFPLLVFVVSMASHLYWMLFRVVPRVDIHDDVLEWRGWRRRGSCALTELQRVRPSRFGGDCLVFEGEAGLKFLAPKRNELDEFVELVRRNVPHVVVRRAWFTRFLDGPQR